MGRDAKKLQSHVQGFLDRSRHLGVLREAALRAAIAAGDDVANEVFMYESNEMPMVFEFGAALKPGFCDYKALGCAIRRGVRDDTKGWITDVALKKQGHFEPDESAFVPEIPVVTFDRCQARLQVNQSVRFATVYSTLVHELGHVLGIRGGIDGSESTRGHPNAALAADTVMVHSERYCKPTPLDVMAIQALFQTLPRSSL